MSERQGQVLWKRLMILALVAKKRSGTQISRKTSDLCLGSIAQ